MNTSSKTHQGITPPDQDYSQWYLDIIKEAQLADYSPVKGSMVFKPQGFALWEAMKNELDQRIKDTGHVNAYFPLFIPMSFLSKEADHVEGFAKECAVVTHHRLRSKESGGVEPDPHAQLEEPLIVRPTSETIIWHMYGKWVESWRDLPILINQWANVVRWELKTRPFLRTAEFLWQEGHTAHATEEEAQEEALKMIDVYAEFAESVLALPVIVGKKSASERFAGAEETYTIEAMMQNGWALQSGTSHFLGQNFAKAFDVTYSTESGEQEHVWATSWGVSTRLIGAVIMSHSDETGLILPPKIAPQQVVVVPIYRKEEEKKAVLEFAKRITQSLKQVGIRVHCDNRDNLKPGAKYFEWERKGVPLRLEIGPRDIENNAVMAKSRLGGEKMSISIQDITQKVPIFLEKFQQELLKRSQEHQQNKTYQVSSYEEFKTQLVAKPGFYLAPWAANTDNEALIKQETKATIRCYPLALQGEEKGKTCFYSGQPATHMAIFARAY